MRVIVYQGVRHALRRDNPEAWARITGCETIIWISEATRADWYSRYSDTYGDVVWDPPCSVEEGQVDCLECVVLGRS